MRRRSTSYVLPVAGFTLALGIVSWYKFIYHPADQVVDAYVVQSPDGLRVNFIDYYHISVNAGNQRTPVYLESTHHRFHSLQAKTGRVFLDIDMGDSVYIGRSPYAVWFLKDKSVLALDPAAGKECGRENLTSDKYHGVEYSIVTDIVKITYPDGNVIEVRRPQACSRAAEVYIPTQRAVDIAFTGDGPRKSITRGGKSSRMDFLSPDLLRTRFFANRNMVNSRDAWNRIQSEITVPITDPSGNVYIQHKKALNQAGEFISAVSSRAEVVWGVEGELRGSFILSDPDGFTILPNKSPLLFRQTALHIDGSGTIDWKFAY